MESLHAMMKVLIIIQLVQKMYILGHPKYLWSTKCYHHSRMFPHFTSQEMSPTPTTRQPLFKLLPPKTGFSFLVVCMNGIIQYVLFHLASCFSDPLICWHAVVLYCFLFLNSFPLCNYTRYCIFIFLWMKNRMVPSFWQL